MNRLFDDADVPRADEIVAPGATWVPGWLERETQRYIVKRFHEWARGPVPLHSPTVRGGTMSVQMVCLGWHWHPYAYTRRAVDVNDRPVLPLPDWMVELGQQAIAQVGGDGAARRYCPDVALVNYYDVSARMGMHQDRDERSAEPVVSLSIGDTAIFRFGNTENRNRPHRDIQLASGDLFVFGGPSRLAYHGITRVIPGTAPADCGLTEGRINITMRVTGL